MEQPCFPLGYAQRLSGQEIILDLLTSKGLVRPIEMDTRRFETVLGIATRSSSGSMGLDGLDGGPLRIWSEL